MRLAIGKLIAELAENNQRFLALTGDHGYALFDEIRKSRPKQYINVGVAEQAMVGLAAGLARCDFLPLIYGLAAFVPLRVVEQIKLDLCTASLPVIIIGDGGGLVYSTLGFSHQAGEDIACLRSMPHIRIYTPADIHEFKICFSEAQNYRGPSYIRIGKSDRPELEFSKQHLTTESYFTQRGRLPAAIVAHGSMSSLAAHIAKESDLSSISVPRLKPFPTDLAKQIAPFSQLIVLEEHSVHGGLTSAICEHLCLNQLNIPKISSLTLLDKFTEFAGDYQFALSEHGMSDPEVMAKVKSICGLK